MRNIHSSQFESLFLQSTHWIDVRSPIEFKEGSIPGSVNLPLLDDDERRQIGTMYKQSGKEAAIRLGHQLVTGDVRERKIQSWISEIQKNPDSIIYCFRGGLRSQISQSWLVEKKIHRPLVEGGYKALRRYLIHVLEERSAELNLQVVSGPTGSGKTNYIKSAGKPFIDLEGIARHRGSAFGGMRDPQPKQIDFENALAVEILKNLGRQEPVLIENESRKIGRCYIPDKFYSMVKLSPKIVLEVSLEDRVENIFRDYILHSELGTEKDLKKFDEFRASIQAISKKLGGLRAQELLKDIGASQTEFETNYKLESNKIWIRKLLTWYYDPQYKGQYQKS